MPVHSPKITLEILEIIIGQITQGNMFINTTVLDMVGLKPTFKKAGPWTIHTSNKIIDDLNQIVKLHGQILHEVNVLITKYTHERFDPE